jgi:AraC-like DNA-binding protein
MDGFLDEPLFLTHIGWEQIKPYEAYPRPAESSYFGFTWADGRVLGEFSLIYVLDGEGELHTKKHRLQLHPGQAYLLKPGEWHRHRPIAEVGWSIMWIKFNGNFPRQWMSTGVFRFEKNIVHITDPALFEAQFMNLLKAAHSLGAHNSRAISWQSISLLALLVSDGAVVEEAENPHTASDPVVDAALDFIWTQDCSQFGVEDVADHVGLNRRTLERRFKAANHVTLLSEIQRCRTARAELLLMGSDMNIKYVLSHCGFANYQHMRKVFQKQFGLSPEAFRVAADKDGSFASDAARA